MKRPENEQEKPTYAYVQPNQPYPQPQYDNQYAMGQPAYKPEGVGNPNGQPLVISNNKKNKKIGMKPLKIKENSR